MILGTGIDIVEISRIETMLEKHHDRFLKRTFTNTEIAIGNQKGKAQTAYYAGRWAAKEAAAKALGCGFSKDCGFLDLEITNDDAGKPILRFSGPAKELTEKLGTVNCHISISHEAHYATAMVILES